MQRTEVLIADSIKNWFEENNYAQGVSVIENFILEQGGVAVLKSN